MTDTIRLGSEKPRPTRPVTHLPNRLDAEACLGILAAVHPDWTIESLKAAGKKLDVADVDMCLEYTSLSLADRMVLKAALSQFGIIARGKRIGA
jgi:hypothetical protein